MKSNPVHRDQYTVDSTFRSCCNAIGRHARSCTVSTLRRAASATVTAHTEVATAIAGLPADSSIWAAVDLACALGHLRQAAALIDQAVETVSAKAVALSGPNGGRR